MEGKQQIAKRRLFTLVGRAGFEPAAGSSRARRDNGAAGGDGPKGEQSALSCTTHQCKKAPFCYLLFSLHKY